MKNIALAALILSLAACSSSRPVEPELTSCKLRLIYCPAGYRCNIATDLCEPCSDGGACDDAGMPSSR